MKRLAVIFALAVLQDPALAKIDFLIQQLSDGDLEVRERAKGELFRMGPPVLEALRKRAVSSDAAASAELKSIIAQHERDIMLGEYRGKASLIRLKAERQPLKKVLIMIGDQSRTPIATDPIPEDDLVSIELNDVPFFEAVDRVCRAHKGLRMKLENTYPPGEEIPLHGVRLARGTPEAGHRFVDGQFAVEMESLVAVRTSEFADKEETWCDFILRAAWERGAQPIRAELVVTTAVDDQGNEYKGEWLSGGRPRKMFIPSRFHVRFDKYPPAGVRKFRQISGTLELDFPADVEILRLANPAGNVGASLSGAAFAFKLVDFKKVDGGYTCVFEHRSAGHGQPSWDRDMRLVDKAGKTYLGQSKRMISSDAAGMVQREIRFEVPAATEIAELRHTDLIGGKPRRIEWKFKDVPLR